MMRTAVGSSPRELHSLLRDGVATGLTDQELLERFATCRDRFGRARFRHPGRPAWADGHERLPSDASQPGRCRRRFPGDVPGPGSEGRGHPLWNISGPVALWRQCARGPPRSRRGLAPSRDRARRGIGRDDPANEPRRVDRDLRFAIDEALARLPANYRAAIVSCYLEGLTHEEAAVRLRCPVGTIRSRLARGRALLRDRLERSGLAA